MTQGSPAGRADPGLKDGIPLGFGEQKARSLEPVPMLLVLSDGEDLSIAHAGRGNSQRLSPLFEDYYLPFLFLGFWLD